MPLVHGRDVFTRMATGAGKSLCMYLAPLALGESAVGVVISPLNALMEQQVQVFCFQVHHCWHYGVAIASFPLHAFMSTIKMRLQ